MKQLRFIILSLLLINSLYSTKGLYVSPGLQVGYNSNQGLFYGFQLSMGIVFKTGDHTLPISFVPSVCYGYKVYHKSKMVEKYKDLQITKFHKKILKNKKVMDFDISHHYFFSGILVKLIRHEQNQ